jgi:hypothetical protein
MASEEDWLFRPIMRGMCRYESLKDGTLNLLDISKMNEAIDVEIENQKRLSRG